MRSLRLALAFIRVPRLFVSLFLWPLLIGLIIVVVQTVLSSGMLKMYNEDSESFKKRLDREGQNTFFREMLYDSDQAVPPLTVCRWISTSSGEVPPSPDCMIDKRDVVVRINTDPATTDSREYESVFTGAARRLHLCRTCNGSLEVDVTGEKPATYIHDLHGAGVLFLSDSERFGDISGHLVSAMDDQERLEKLQGTVYVRPAGLKGVVNLSASKNSMILIINVAVIVIVAAWLALKAHRRVLDYFVKNEALLPLVAACGKSTMYKALWILSLSRVTLFLLSAIVPLYVIYLTAGNSSGENLFAIQNSSLMLWMACIIFGLSSVTIVVSVSDLKQRHSLSSFLYRAVPFSLWIIGTSVWFATLLYSGPIWSGLQNLIIATPLFGLSAVILAPIVPVKPALLGAHALLSVLLTLVVMSRNTNWFAAHLEEL